MAHPAGGFYSAEDADSDRSPADGGGHAEGAFYVWSKAEIDRVLPPAVAALVCSHFGIEAGGNVPAGLDPHGEFTGFNILKQVRPLAETAAALGHDIEVAADRLGEALERLRAVRTQRPRPHLDDKILAAWNGLALTALSRAAVHPAECLADKRAFYLEAALRCARFIERELIDPTTGRLLRSWREGQAAIDGFAEDYACVTAGLLDVHQATLDSHWLALAQKLQATLDARFWDEAEGGYFSAPEGTELILRLKDDYDGAEPTASSVALGNLVRLSVLTGEPAAAASSALAPYRHRAERLAQGFRSQWSTAPHALPVMLCALADWLAEPAHVVLAGDPRDPAFTALASAVHGAPPISAPLHLLTPDCAEWAAGMTAQDGRPTAYLCRDLACQPPVTTPSALRALLDS
ncbi:MAG: hypothetical protein NTU80_07275 [Verrucomicrobia bacterium]|nr:hypothetical protein [Verrucomicrobiota bacterium]